MKLADAILKLAIAIERLAATQEKPENRSKMSTWGTASYDSTDPQTKALRQIELERERSGNSRASKAPTNRRS